MLRWKKDGMPYPGTGGLALVLVPAAVSDSGTYQLLLERPDGTIVGGLTVQLRVVDPVIFLPATN